MHKNLTEHSTPQIVDGYKVYNVNGAPFELPQYYTLIKSLGMGAYGVVCSILDTRTTPPKLFAAKKCLNVFRDLEDGKRVLREISLMRFVDGHPNLMPIVDILPPRNGRRFKDVYLVLPLMDVDLNVILRSRQVLEENHYQFFCYQMLAGLRYMHLAGIAHRDLKPANLMCSISCELRICDFGLARELSELSTELTDYVVTRWYRAPELLLMSTAYGPAIDIWAVGMIFAEMFTRRPIAPAKSSLEQLRLLSTLFGKPTPQNAAGLLASIEDPAALRMLNSVPDTPGKPMSQICPKLTNPLGLDFLSKMLCFDPSKRWTAEQLMNHEYLAGVRDPPGKELPKPKGEFHWEHEHKKRMTLDDLRNGFWKEMCAFHPELEKLAQAEAAAAAAPAPGANK